MQFVEGSLGYVMFFCEMKQQQSIFEQYLQARMYQRVLEGVLKSVL